jgi:hypothetical protein
MAKTLVVSSQPVVNGSALGSILHGGIAQLDTITIATNSKLLQKGALPQSTFSVAFSFAEETGAHDAQLLAELHSSLAPSGTLTIIEKGHEDTAALEKRLVLAGFVGCKKAVSPNGDAMVEAQKPAWQSGSSAPLKLRQPAQAVNGGAEKPQAKKAWNLEGDDELVDDDELLTEEDLQRPAPAEDCGVASTKKACKNCTCGRAEGIIEKVDLTPEMLENPQSGCGSCGLGDAFRCQTCPYRGLPAFEKGKKIELPSDFLTADA